MTEPLSCPFPLVGVSAVNSGEGGAAQRIERACASALSLSGRRRGRHTGRTPSPVLRSPQVEVVDRELGDAPLCALGPGLLANSAAYVAIILHR